MRWKKNNSNLIVVSLLSFAYFLLTLLMIIGPLHMNSTGNINQPGATALYSLLFLVFALMFSWFVYTALRNYPRLSFFTLIISGIAIIFAATFLWT